MAAKMKNGEWRCEVLPIAIDEAVNVVEVELTLSSTMSYFDAGIAYIRRGDSNQQ